MEAAILGIATALPPYVFSQNEILEKIIEVLPIDPQKIKDLRNLYNNSGIRTRYSIVPDFKKERAEWHFWGSNYPQAVPGMTQRNATYKKEASKLAFEAAGKALKTWGGNPSDITHVISVSCTGVMAPGIEFDLVGALNLKRSVNRLGINLMGCFGAFKGLSVAQAFAKEHPSHRILLVCTELCSLHFHHTQNPDNILANSLFSDGASAVVVGAHPQSAETPHWMLAKQYCVAFENTLDKMSWEAGDEGFFMKLSPTVPVLLGRQIQSFTDGLLEETIKTEECNWAIHPGGKSIIQAIERAMKLDPNQTLASWDVLANYGNMSSASFLFVLESLYRQKSKRKWTIGLGFGPGLSIEGLLLRNPDDHAN